VTFWNSILRSITENARQSLHDALLVVSVMAVAGLLVIEFELFQFAHTLTDHERRVSLAEAVFLTVLLGLCIAVFVYRRMRDSAREREQRSKIDSEMQELRAQALRDPLTDLANRRAVFARLGELGASSGPHAFFLLDLNDFKSVNDQFGHAAGDWVLQVVAERFKRVARPTDLLARLGGDEFAILASDVDRAGAEAVGDRFIRALDNQVRVDGVGHDIGVAVGAVLIPADCKTAAEILANADIAMYRAKAAGRSALVFFCDVKVDAASAPRATG
jgi:diguanylate cyclase (GGDEF)-like protein